MTILAAWAWSSSNAVSPKSEKPQPPSFVFIPWPGPNTVSRSEIHNATETNPFIQAWNESRLLTYTGRTLKILSSKSDSLDKFVRTILYSEPECIEGDPEFIEQEINSKKNLYCPLLQETFTQTENSDSISGVIVFLEQSDLWHGTLGVVHPNYSVGGKFQIDQWKKETGREPDVTIFYSPQETLRHLFIGNIQAAAIPDGAVEEFLQEHNRMDLIDRLIVIRIQEKTRLPVLFLRRDLYVEPLMRTLITETWLRDHFQDQMQPLPVRGPRG